MNAMTCPEVEAQLDLLAAGECTRPTQQQIERHLEHCANCAASFAESQRLLGLLDLHWDTAGPERVRERIEQEVRQQRRRTIVLPFARRVAALAAMLLVAVGLSGWLPKFDTQETEPELQLAALEVRNGGIGMMMERVIDVHAPADSALVRNPMVKAAMVAGQSGEEFRHELLQAQRGGKLPLPPPIPLALELKNNGDRTQEIRLGDAATELTLDVWGNGVVRVPAVGVEEPAFLRPRTVRLAPGEAFVFRIDRLIAGSRGGLSYLYLTEPGDYTLTARLRATVGNQVVTVRSATSRLHVDK